MLSKTDVEIVLGRRRLLLVGLLNSGKVFKTVLCCGTALSLTSYSTRIDRLGVNEGMSKGKEDGCYFGDE